MLRQLTDRARLNLETTVNIIEDLFTSIISLRAQTR